MDELRAAGLVELRGREGYALTAMGREVGATFLPLNAYRHEMGGGAGRAA